MISELELFGWQFDGATCGNADVSINGATVTVHLGDADHVTCVYTNEANLFIEEDPTLTPTPTKTPSPTVTPDPSSTPTQPPAHVGGITPPNTGDGGVHGGSIVWLVLGLAAFSGIVALALRVALATSRDRAALARRPRDS